MRLKVLITLILLGLFCGFLSARESSAKKRLNKVTTIGLLDTLFINNIFLPFQNDGSTAEDAQAYFPNPGVPVPPGFNQSFLFQGGIAASGYVNGELRASWMAKASLIQEFQPGKWGMDPDDPRARFYRVTSDDGPGSPNYVDWAQAVELGADFQDLNGDGVYDPNVDAPDLLGNRVSWTVYNDGTDISIRTDGLQTDPLGLEIHQQVWAFARGDELGNVIFFRYRMINVTNEDIDDLIFSIWTDPDIGEATDDLIGSDIDLSLGYCYNNGADNDGSGPYGNTPPAFGVDFFQGPVVESPGDTAFLFRGPFFGVDTLVGFRNLPMTSFTFYNNDPSAQTDFPSPGNNVIIARRYQEGGVDGNGNPIDPTVFGVGGTPATPPQFFYSGNPNAGTGWRDITEADKRFMVNTGPFQLAAGDTQDIVVAYVVGQGSNAFESVDELKRIDQIAQLAYDANFFVAGPPPPPAVTVRTFDRKIEFVIDLEKNKTIDYNQPDKLLNRQVFEGVKIYQLASPSTNEFESGVLNRKLIARYDLKNEYKDIYLSSGFETRQIYAGANNVDTTTFVDEGSAIIRHVVEVDEFNQRQPLVNNVEYFFSITAFSINRPFLTNLNAGSWVGPTGILLENNLGGRQLYRVIPNSDENRPFRSDSAKYTGPRKNFDGRVVVDVVNNAAVTGDDYSVRFFNNGNLYRIVRESDGNILRDNLAYQDSVGGNSWSFPIIEGLSIKVQNVPDGIASGQVVDLGEGQVNWIQGAGTFTKRTSAFGGGIELIQNSHRSNLSPGLPKADYFPVEVRLSTSDDVVAQHFRANWLLPSGMKPTFLSAVDISDPDNPRQLYVGYLNASPQGTIDFSANNEVIIFNADYQETERYGRASTDTLFRKEAYMILQLRATADSLFQANPLTLRITPYFPNSDVDVFRIEGEGLSPQLTRSEAVAQLEKVKVVPNPYWAYSAYENSYDTPVLKFTHLPRQVTIRIFNLAGQLIKTLQKDDSRNELSWNLRNEASLKIASGMYLAHIEAPGVGEKILKFAVIQREERLDRF